MGSFGFASEIAAKNAKAVEEKLGTYGELFGPLSFFRPTVIPAAIVSWESESS